MAVGKESHTPIVIAYTTQKIKVTTGNESTGYPMITYPHPVAGDLPIKPWLLGKHAHTHTHTHIHTVMPA